MFTSSGKKICVFVASFLFALSAHPALGKCPAGTSTSQTTGAGEWCLFCPDGSPATQNFGSEVSCKCGSDDCSVTLDGKPSSISAYQKAIKVPSSDVEPELISSSTESSTSESSSSTSSETASSTVSSGVTTVAEEVQEAASYGFMSGASLMTVVMAAFAA